MKKRRGPGFYLILMLLQPLVLALFFLVGAVLDSRLWEGAASVPGHPAPAFTVVLTLLGGAICLVVFLAALVGLVLSLRRRRKEKQAAREAPEEPKARFCPRCGALMSGRFCANCGERIKQE